MEIYREYIKPISNTEAIEFLSKNEFIRENKIRITKAELNPTAYMDEGYSNVEGVQRRVLQHMSFDFNIPQTDNNNYLFVEIFYDQKHSILTSYYSSPTISCYIFDDKETDFKFYIRFEWHNVFEYLRDNKISIPDNLNDQIIAILKYIKETL